MNSDSDTDSNFADIHSLLSVLVVRLQYIDQIVRDYDGICGGQAVLDALAARPLMLFMQEALEKALAVYAGLN